VLVSVVRAWNLTFHQVDQNRVHVLATTVACSAEELAFDSRQDQLINRFCIISRPALGPSGVPGHISPRGKAASSESDHFSLSSADVETARSFTSTPPYVYV
jgi:hypothetical protein